MHLTLLNTLPSDAGATRAWLHDGLLSLGHQVDLADHPDLEARDAAALGYALADSWTRSTPDALIALGWVAGLAAQVATREHPTAGPAAAGAPRPVRATRPSPGSSERWSAAVPPFSRRPRPRPRPWRCWARPGPGCGCCRTPSTAPASPRPRASDQPPEVVVAVRRRPRRRRRRARGDGRRPARGRAGPRRPRRPGGRRRDRHRRPRPRRPAGCRPRACRPTRCAARRWGWLPPTGPRRASTPRWPSRCSVASSTRCSRARCA